MNPFKGRSPPIKTLHPTKRIDNIALVGKIIDNYFIKHLKKQIMKDQSINTVNAKAEFLDITTARNPIYQPLAEKLSLSTEIRALIKDNSNREKMSVAKNETVNTTQAPEPIVATAQIESSEKENIRLLQVEPKTERAALNLESTLKLVEELHRRMVQRGRLVYIINNLDKFEIEQKEEAEDTASNYYQGCELQITDDKRNKFSTKNPVIIKAVALFVRELCTNRLGEIEAEITLPA
ncbi:hypothetical protein [Pedobacter mucosus]|uniref:hypothetical protein n=1 Tax=Pedobacter mucosus TaxID=2895286 RepID=UPI001EE42297|nr:hypothetical protein [Pedobacter mucosus]UKT62711.1 hypothetical protein LOK61_13170 [Pedobacter mucosus]